MDSRWNELASGMLESLAELRPGQFLVVEYLAEQQCEPLPYAQAAPELDDWYCEVVSDRYLSPLDWPLNELALRRAGWKLPDDETQNWWSDASTATDGARLMIDALRNGRGCCDPERYVWTVGTFPTGPRGGEPLPFPERAPTLVAA